MSNAYLSPILQDAQFNDDGTFLVGGLIWFYEAGTSTPLLAYTTPVADTAWTNPIQLNARGETSGEIWLKAGSSYKLILEGPPEYGQTHGVVLSTFDNITGVNDPGNSAIANWIDFSGTPTYLNATSFYLVGDQRATFLESRRIKMTNSDASIYYGTVVSSSYALGSTTIVVSPDFGQVVSEYINAVAYGFVETGAVSSIPVAVNAGSAASGSQYQMWMDYDPAIGLRWATDNGALSLNWPMTSAKATAASGITFATDTATSGEAQLQAKYTGVNDAYLYNSAARWGIYSADGGTGINFDRATSTFSYGGFTLPAIPGPRYFKLPNGMILQYGIGTASSAGTAVTFATAFTSGVVAIAVTQIGTTHVAVSWDVPTTTQFNAYCTGTESISYIAIGV